MKIDQVIEHIRKIDDPDGCWVWTGFTAGRGYPMMWLGGERFYVHRWMWEQENGPVPEGLEIGHRCDNRVCVRPDHLEAITHAQNMSDAGTRGRMPRGSAASWSKLTEDEVLEIRSRAYAGERQSSIAASLGLSHSLVSLIVNRKRWAWL